MLIKINFKKELIYLIILIPICFLKYIVEFYITNSKENYYLFIEPFSQIVMIFLYLYQKKSSKVIMSKSNHRTFKLSKNNLKKQYFKKIILILCSNIFFLFTIYLKKFHLENIHSHTIIIFLVDLLFFQKQIYSHQSLSIILNLFSYIIILFINPSSIYELWYNFLLLIIHIYCDSFSILLIKYINLVYFTSIYLLAFLIGLFSFSFQLILINFTFDEIEKQQYSLIIVYFIICLIFNLLYYVIVLKLEPIHSKISIQICYVFNRYIMEEKKKTKSKFELLKIIAGLIYLEIIEFNFWGLNKNLKQNIFLRSEDDIKNYDDEKESNENIIIDSD